MSLTPRELAEHVASDTRHGATELALCTLRAIITLTRDQPSPTRWRQTLLELIPELRDCRPSMSALRNLLQDLYTSLSEATVDQPEEFSALVVSRCEALMAAACQSQSNVVEAALSLIAEGDVIMTHSLSSTIRRLCTRLAAEHRGNRIVVSESRPGNEGQNLAGYAASLELPVTLITDAQIDLFVPAADKVIVGADAVLADGSIINKAGTALLALSARYHGVPFYVCAESFKQQSDNTLHLEEMPAAELGYQCSGVEVRNLYFERVPAELITGWIK